LKSKKEVALDIISSIKINVKTKQRIGKVKINTTI
jgi:hypothetical protein